MTLNTIKNITMISSKKLCKIFGGIFPPTSSPDIALPGMVEPIKRGDTDKDNGSVVTGGW